MEITWLELVKDVEEKSRFINRLAQNAKDNWDEVDKEKVVNVILKLQNGYSRSWKSQLSRLLRLQRQKLNSFVAQEASTSSKSQSRQRKPGRVSQSESNKESK